MEKTDSAAKAEAFVRANGKTLLEAAEKVLKDNGFSYSVQLMLGQYDFPDRTYGEAFFPAGEYNALRVVLGNGAGQNWWCVLFPPLCIVTEESVAVDPDDIYFSSSILEWLKKWGVIA